MKKWTIRILVLLFLLTGSACSQSVPPAEGEETLLVQGESGGPENLPPAFDPVVPAAEAVDPQWFADAAFVGDSVSVMLENYNTSTGRLGSPAFFCSVSLSQTNALSYQAGNARLPEYPKGSGQHPLVADGIASAGAKKVYLIQNLDFLTGEKKLQDKIFSLKNVEIITGATVKSLLGDRELAGIEVVREKDGVSYEISLDGLFIAIGLLPQNEPFEKLISLDDRGYADSDESCETKTRGIFVAGDCRKKKVRQVTTAAADGAAAAIAACDYHDSLN